MAGGYHLKLFSKKSADTKAKKADVPGELPPLGGLGSNPGKAGEGVPDELPNLDAPAAPPSQPAEQAPSPEPEAPEAVEDAPDVLPDIAVNGAAANDVAANEVKVASARPADATIPSSSEFQEDYPSFFSKNLSVNSAGAGGSLLVAMKKYWDKNRLQEVPYESEVVNETEAAIQEKISKLKSLERSWLARMQDFNVLKQNIAYLETEISLQSDELTALLKYSGRRSFAKQPARPKKAQKPASTKKGRASKY
jgi:hypothetical protein